MGLLIFVVIMVILSIMFGGFQRGTKVGGLGSYAMRYQSSSIASCAADCTRVSQ
jgi:hypothetical protein